MHRTPNDKALPHAFDSSRDYESMLTFDLRRYLDVPHQDSATGGDLGRFLQLMVQAGTARACGAPWRSALGCRLSPCAGRVIVHRPDSGGSIGWRCPRCHDEGEVVGWIDTVFDLRHGSAIEPPDRWQWPVPFETVAVVGSLETLGADNARVVFAALEDGPCAVVAATTAEFEALLETTLRELSRASRPRRRELRAAADVLDRLLAARRGLGPSP